MYIKCHQQVELKVLNRKLAAWFFYKKRVKKFKSENWHRIKKIKKKTFFPSSSKNSRAQLWYWPRLHKRTVPTEKFFKKNVFTPEFNRHFRFKKKNFICNCFSVNSESLALYFLPQVTTPHGISTLHLEWIFGNLIVLICPLQICQASVSASLSYRNKTQKNV